MRTFAGRAHSSNAAIPGVGWSSLGALGAGLCFVALVSGEGRAQSLFEASFLAFDAGAGPLAIAVADLNGDGVPDIVNTQSVLLGGRLETKIELPRRDGIDLALADMDRDGELDVALLTKRSVAVLMGLGDGMFVAGASYCLGAYGACHPAREAKAIAVADFNADERPDVAVALEPDTVCVLLGTEDGRLRMSGGFTVGVHPEAILSADLNGDSKPDLVTASNEANSISVLAGNGDGTFASAIHIETALNPRSLVSGDWNGDRIVDLVVASAAATSVFLGRGDGGFEERLELPFGAFGITAADLNVDGHLDLVASNNWFVDVLFGRGDGTFAHAARVVAGHGARSAAVTDLNRDGDPDLAVLNRISNSVTVHYGHADGTFGSGRQMTTGDSPTRLVVADLNADEVPDLVSFSGSTRELFVFLGLGSAEFRALPAIIPGVNPRHFAVADLNADEFLDLVFSNGNYSTATVLTGAGDGTFHIGQPFKTGGITPNQVAAADVNADGRVDLAITHDSGVSVHLGRGDATFGVRTDYSFGQSFEVGGDVLFADVNADTKLDLLVANPTIHAISVLLGRGDGGFGTRQVFPAGDSPLSIATGDLNEDGNLDVAAANYKGGQTGSVSLLLGNGDGTFQAPRIHDTDRGAQRVVVADADRDGHEDLVVVNTLANTISILLGHGDGSLTPQTHFGAGADPRDVALADLDGGGAELIVANQRSSNISILRYLGHSVPVRITDLYATSTPEGVHLAWTVAQELEALAGVHVQRAAALEGPYLERTQEPLASASRMSFDDRDVQPGRLYWYRLVTMERDGARSTVGPIRVQVAGVLQTRLRQVVELEGDASVQITYAIANPTPVHLAIYDVRGRQVRELIRGAHTAGEYTRLWDRRAASGTPASRGIYFVRLRTSAHTDSKKLVLLAR